MKKNLDAGRNRFLFLKSAGERSHIGFNRIPDTAKSYKVTLGKESSTDAEYAIDGAFDREAFSQIKEVFEKGHYRGYDRTEGDILRVGFPGPTKVQLSCLNDGTCMRFVVSNQDESFPLPITSPICFEVDSKEFLPKFKFIKLENGLLHLQLFRKTQS